MKNVKVSLVCSVMFLFGASYLSSCKDPCKKIDCNNGHCEDKVCICEEGYTGEFCDIEERSSFLGIYSASDQCSSSGSAKYTVSIASSSTSTSNILLKGLWELFSSPVKATVDGATITIASQDPDGDGYKISGAGTISGNKIMLSYQVNSPDGTEDTCESTMTKQ